MNLIRREFRTPVLESAFEPTSLVRSLLRWDPFRGMEFPEAQASYLPSFDIREVSTGYLFMADLPGVSQEDLDINITGNR